MSKCTNIHPVQGCFKPNSGGDFVPIIIHVIYDLDEIVIGQTFTLGDDNETPINPTTFLGGGTVTSGSCHTSVMSPRWYIGDKGAFLGTLKYDDLGGQISWDVISGNSPSSIGRVAYSEYPYSFTNKPSSGDTLEKFIANNSNGNFDASKVLSLSILVEDELVDLKYSIRGMTSTILKANQLRNITFGEGQDYPIFEKFFNEFEIGSEPLLTVTWEQGEI